MPPILGNILVIAVLAVIVALVIRSAWKRNRRARREGGCGCGCSGCAHRASCHSDKK